MKAKSLLLKPLNEWQNIKAPAVDLQDIERELSAIVQRATLLEAYIAHRYNTGCGDQGHDASARHANGTLIKVRKALGFSYPKNTPLHL